ncbi:MAG: DNA polymerase III subunit delta' [Spirochaetota bacterium]|nr:DNA polymerase III subunit delta' [Spirochaetota bacterium]
MTQILGNTVQQSIILHGAKNNILPHSLLFSGLEGIGKKLCAVKLAKTMLCASGNACGACPSCKQIDHATHPDVIIIEPNEKGNIPIGSDEQEGSIRWLIGRVNLASLSQKRVIIINDAHCMNIQSQNALLKTIEEPPAHTFIILISSERNQLLPTIHSRVTEYVFHPLSDSDLVSILQKSGIDRQTCDSIIPVAGGSVSYALTLARDDLYSQLKEAYSAIASFVCQPEVFSYDLSPILQEIGAYRTIDLLINIFRLHCTKNVVPWLHSTLDQTHAIEIIKILLELRKGISHNINIRMALKGMLYSLCFTK